MTRSRAALAAYALIGVCSGIFVLRTASPRFIWDDDGIYISTARALHESGEYRLVNLPGAPPQTKYPPLYPVLLSAVWPQGADYEAAATRLKAVNALGLAVVVLLAGVLGRRGADDRTAAGIAVAVLTASSPTLVSHAEQLISDIWFVVFLLAVCCIPRRARWTTTEAVVACSLAGLSALTRTVGLAVILGVLFSIWRRSSWRTAVAGALAAAAFTVPWETWRFVSLRPVSPLLEGYVTYERPLWLRLPEMPTLASRLILRNAAGFANVTAEVIGTITLGLTLAVLGVALLGLWRRRAESWAMTAVAIAVPYLVVVIGHPYPMLRYLVPLVPLVMIGFVSGVLEVYRRSQAVNLRGAVVIAAGVAAGVWLTLNFVGLTRFSEATRNAMHGGFGRPMPFVWHGFEETFAYVHERTRPSTVLATPYDALYSVYTGRPAVRPWFHASDLYEPKYGVGGFDCEDPEALRTELLRLNVAYLIIDPMLSDVDSGYGASCLRELLERHPADWQLVFVASDQQHRVYRARSSP